jgi:hypothetical protein
MSASNSRAALYSPSPPLYILFFASIFLFFFFAAVCRFWPWSPFFF